MRIEYGRNHLDNSASLVDTVKWLAIVFDRVDQIHNRAVVSSRVLFALQRFGSIDTGAGSRFG